MHTHDALKSHDPGVSALLAAVIAHALVPEPTQWAGTLPLLPSVSHFVPRRHATLHCPQFISSSATHTPWQQKCASCGDDDGQSPSVTQLGPHATVAVDIADAIAVTMKNAKTTWR